jgi:hypothetical protein
MSKQTSLAEVTIAFTRAWSTRDMPTAASYVAEDIVFESPMVQIQGAAPYLESVRHFAEMVSDVNVIAVVSEGDRSIIMYDMTTGPFGVVRAAEHFVFENGKIKSDQLVFDTHEVRKALGSSG